MGFSAFFPIGISWNWPWRDGLKAVFVTVLGGKILWSCVARRSALKQRNQRRWAWAPWMFFWLRKSWNSIFGSLYWYCKKGVDIIEWYWYCIYLSVGRSVCLPAWLSVCIYIYILVYSRNRCLHWICMIFDLYVYLWLDICISINIDMYLQAARRFRNYTGLGVHPK